MLPPTIVGETSFHKLKASLFTSVKGWGNCLGHWVPRLSYAIFCSSSVEWVGHWTGMCTDFQSWVTLLWLPAERSQSIALPARQEGLNTSLLYSQAVVLWCNLDQAGVVQRGHHTGLLHKRWSDRSQHSSIFALCFFPSCTILTSFYSFLTEYKE